MSSDVPKLQRYVRQLVVMSKLRNLQDSTLQTIETMPFEFDIEDDVIYQRGRKEGIEKKREEMIKEMLRDGALSLEKIAAYTHVSLDYVNRLQQKLTR